MIRVKSNLSYHARILAAWLADGSTLHLQFGATEEEGSEGNYFWIEPAGKRVGVKSAQELIAKGEVVPLDAGLFPGQPQSWRLASPAEAKIAVEAAMAIVPTPGA